MSADFYIKRGATLPKLKVTMADSAGAAVDLSLASVSFRLRPVDASSPTLSRSATVVSAATGVAEYAWQVGDTATAGSYVGEFVVSANGATQVVPSARLLRIEIVDSLA